MPANAKSHRPWVIASVMSSMSMTAFEATIVATAMPQIVADLGGLSLYSWVFSGYLLAQTAMTVVFGKLADLVGRKPMVLAGVAIFILGSILAGFAWSMESLIFFRLLQGIGAGAIQPVNLTIIGDLYPGTERAKVQGWLASVWAVSAVAGPILGGVIIANVSWAWVFWINVPVGLVSTWGFVKHLHEDKGGGKPAIDWTGAALFTVSVSALMIALTDISSTSAKVIAISVAVAVVFAALFAWQEKRAKEPMISFELWSRKPIAVANSGALLSGMVLMGITSFLPMYVQGVLHQSPVTAGLALTMSMLGWPVGATLGVRSLGRYGPRPVAITGGVFHVVGAIMFALLGPGSSAVLAGIGSLALGFGMGLYSNAALVMVQSIVDGSQRGSATAAHLFSRNLGSTLGAALFGAVLNYGLAHSSIGRAVSTEELQALLTASAAGNAGGAVDRTAGAVASSALHASLHLTFLSLLAVSVGIVLLTLLIPTMKIGGRTEAKVSSQDAAPPH